MPTATASHQAFRRGKPDRCQRLRLRSPTGGGAVMVGKRDDHSAVFSIPEVGQLEQPMRAVVRDAYGSVDVLRLGEVAKPVAGDAEGLVRVYAAGVDQGVWHLMAGMPYVMRLAGFGVRAPKNPFLGYDVAGRVEAVGTNAGSFRPGDAVFGTC